MNDLNSTYAVRLDQENSRYTLVDLSKNDEVIGEEVFVDYKASSGLERILIHTKVSPDYGGQGLASFLVRSVVDDIVSSDAKVVPVCPYVVNWLPRHPEYDEHVVKPNSKHFAAIDEARS